MYERFTDRARKVMQLAEQEARRFNHEYIATEHVLLGLHKEGSGIAANVLKNLDIDLCKIRLEVEKIIVPSAAQLGSGKLQLTPKVREVIGYAAEEARNLNHNYVGTEHLLLGLLREQEGVAAQVLMNLGLKPEDIREEVLNLLGQNRYSGKGGLGSMRYHDAVAYLLGKEIKLTDKQAEVLSKVCDALETLKAGEGKTTLLQALAATDK